MMTLIDKFLELDFGNFKHPDFASHQPADNIAPMCGQVFSIALICRTYNGMILTALKSDRTHRQELYAELKNLLCAYLDPYLGDDLIKMHSKVMICPECKSEKVLKNGHRHGKQRYICKNCGRQFGIEASDRGYPSEIRQQCLDLHQQGVGFREIERQTGVSHNTVINWVRAASS
jgi:transcription elongation factor Elf1